MKREAKLAVSAGLSALMVAGGLFAGSVSAFADPAAPEPSKVEGWDSQRDHGYDPSGAKTEDQKKQVEEDNGDGTENNYGHHETGDNGYSTRGYYDALIRTYAEEKDGDKAAAELRKEINKNLGVSADDTSTLPGSDDNVYPTDPKMDVAAPSADEATTPANPASPAAPSADGSVAPTQAGDESAAPEESKAEGKKALPQTNDFLATLLPMLGVALGGTSIAFGKRMRH